MLLNIYFLFWPILLYINTLYYINSVYYTYIILILFLNFIFFKKHSFYKINIQENEYWYLVEILNNNNKSILMFFILFLYIFISYKTNKNIFNIYGVQLFIIIFFFIVFLYIFKNNFIKFFNSSLLNNTVLINGVILIHPILIYYSYNYFIILNLFNLKNYFCNNILKNIQKNKFFFFFVSFFGLFLGSFWAQQELNWGGWWNWDYVEIIALIFTVLSLYFIHTNFFKYFNNYYIINRNIFYYLICFGLLVRMDILNSIHSFNSINISKNYKHLLLLFICVFLTAIFLNISRYLYKYKNNFKWNVITLLFRIINTIFFYYFFINIFFIFYFNYQFIDFTKFVKFIFIYIIYTYIFVFIKNKHIILSILFLFLLCFYIINLDLFLLLSFLYLFLNSNFSKKLKFFNLFNISHFFLIIFFLLIRYDCYSQFDNFFIKFKFCNYIVNNDYIFLYNYFNNILNKTSNLNILIYNFYYKNEYNFFFFKKIIYINNIVYNNFCYIMYNIDITVNYLLYNIQIVLFILLLLLLLLLFK